ncbi:secreted protein [Rutstroemia sp. NJR-2017a BBW]|nr:secreted protein [Rutstroemia sp. NJR-2017a BBW]
MFSILLLVALQGLLVHATPLPEPTPPGIPATTTAKTELAALTVKTAGSQDGYDRDLFPTWNTISGTCNTREYVLKRDGTNVVVNSACTATSGTWVSPYDGATWTAASDLDIDHLVPLSNAWKMWIKVKYTYSLTVTSAEKSALTTMIATC